MVGIFSVLWLIWPPNIPFQQRKSISGYYSSSILVLKSVFFDVFLGWIFIFLKFWQHLRPFLSKIGRDNSLLFSDIEYITLIEHFSKKRFFADSEGAARGRPEKLAHFSHFRHFKSHYLKAPTTQLSFFEFLGQTLGSVIRISWENPVVLRAWQEKWL